MIDIKAAREAKGVTQSDLARALHTTPVTVWRWEVGQRHPNLVNVLAIARALGLTVEELTDKFGAPDGMVPAPPAEAAASPEEPATAAVGQ